jgi:hypothetical protein
MEYDPAHKTSSVTSTSSNYDPAHKTSSVSSTNSIWDPLPSLYTGRADSVSSVYELDDLQEPFDEGYHQEAAVVTTDDSSINDFLNSFFKQEEDLVVKKVKRYFSHTFRHIKTPFTLGTGCGSRGALIYSLVSWE